MKKYFNCILGLTFLVSACNFTSNKSNVAEDKPTAAVNNSKEKTYKGAISNGMKGDSISFAVSADGMKLKELTFKGYWRCAGSLESTIAGPEGSYDIKDGKVNGHISEPPGGGSTAWRFDLEASISGENAEGSFRMNINNLGCDTYKLMWKAVRVQ